MASKVKVSGKMSSAPQESWSVEQLQKFCYESSKGFHKSFWEYAIGIGRACRYMKEKIGFGNFEVWKLKFIEEMGEDAPSKPTLDRWMRVSEIGLVAFKKEQKEKRDEKLKAMAKTEAMVATKEEKLPDIPETPTTPQEDAEVESALASPVVNVPDDYDYHNQAIDKDGNVVDLVPPPQVAKSREQIEEEEDLKEMGKWASKEAYVESKISDIAHSLESLARVFDNKNLKDLCSTHPKIARETLEKPIKKLLNAIGFYVEKFTDITKE